MSEARPRYFRAGDEADGELSHRIKQSKMKLIPRVYIKVTPEDSEGVLYTFVDGVMNPGGYPTPYSFEEHNFEMNGKWYNHVTCIEGFPHPVTGIPMPCPICRSVVIPKNQRVPYTGHAYTVINHTPYKVKGELRNPNGDELTLLVAKTKIANEIRRKRRLETPNGGLRGWSGYIIRAESTDSNTGSSIQWKEKIELPENIVAFDYSEILAPKTPEEITKMLVRGGMLVGSGSAPSYASGGVPANASIGEGSDQIPF